MRSERRAICTSGDPVSAWWVRNLSMSFRFAFGKKGHLFRLRGQRATTAAGYNGSRPSVNRFQGDPPGVDWGFRGARTRQTACRDAPAVANEPVSAPRASSGSFSEPWRGPTPRCCRRCARRVRAATRWTSSSARGTRRRSRSRERKRTTCSGQGARRGLPDRARRRRGRHGPRLRGAPPRLAASASRSRCCTPSSRAQPDVVARFQREAEARAAIDHPNVVDVYDVIAPPTAGRTSWASSSRARSSRDQLEQRRQARRRPRRSTSCARCASALARGPREGRRAPRHQAGERVPDAATARRRPRSRCSTSASPRPGDGRHAHLTQDRHDHGHAEVHGARAGARRARSTTAPTSTPSARSSTARSPASGPSTPAIPTPTLSRCSPRSRRARARSSRRSPSRSSSSSSARWRRTPRIATRPWPSSSTRSSRSTSRRSR